MILQYKNNELVPLTLNAGVSGIPVGAIIASMATTGNNNWLLCDGSTYDTNKYPLLYAVLESNTLPDLRECTLVGAGENSTDSIATHDVYTVGEFKDDQLQSHSHTYKDATNKGQYNASGGTLGFFYTYNTATVGSNTSARFGTTTHGKQKGVNFFIKATASAVEGEETAFKQYIRNQNKLSDWEDITLSTSSSSPTVIEYDGFIDLAQQFGYNLTSVNAEIALYINGTRFNKSNLGGVSGHFPYYVRTPVKKGDSIYYTTTGAQDYGDVAVKGCFYKDRDYSDR